MPVSLADGCKLVVKGMLRSVNYFCFLKTFIEFHILRVLEFVFFHKKETHPGEDVSNSERSLLTFHQFLSV
ncbi:hypothetical protein DX926_14755 [Bacillus atrophaeus]|nr:hypothetical protein DX926_14755 [Bacillus atrophaeus]